MITCKSIDDTAGYDCDFLLLHDLFWFLQQFVFGLCIRVGADMKWVIGLCCHVHNVGCMKGEPDNCTPVCLTSLPATANFQGFAPSLVLSILMEYPSLKHKCCENGGFGGFEAFWKRLILSWATGCRSFFGPQWWSSTLWEPFLDITPSE